MKYIEVVAAVFTDENDKIFCARRKEGGELSFKWEFPGGKIEPGETREEALIREIKEELKIDIEITDFLMTVKHQYTYFHLTMHAFKANIVNGEMVLTEHTGQEWLDKSELLKLDWAAADIPIVELLMK